METNLTISSSEKIGRITIIDKALLAGELIFELTDARTVRATHTFVNEDYRGQGIAAKLVDALIEYCTAEGLTIIPVCSYIVKLAQRDECLKKLVKQD